MNKLLLTLAVVMLAPPQTFAGVWETQCAGCHNGSLAPSKTQLKAKYKNPKDFVEAGRKSSSPMMAAFKNNISVLESAAKELYK